MDSSSVLEPPVDRSPAVVDGPQVCLVTLIWSTHETLEVRYDTLTLTELDTDREVPTPAPLPALEGVAAHQRVPGLAHPPSRPHRPVSGSGDLSVTHLRGLALSFTSSLHSTQSDFSSLEEIDGESYVIKQ